MGPNLKRLFDRLPQRPLAIVRDPNGDVLDIVDAHGESLPGRADEAKVIVMLANHGEALIEALEKLVLTWETYADRPNSYPAFGKAKSILSQIEQEAQP